MKFILAMLTLLMLAVPAAWGDAAPDLLLVAHLDVPEDTINEVTVRRIYLGKKTRWNSDLKITPVMMKDGDLHRLFVKKILNRTVANFETYWKQAVFTGRGIPPRSFETEQELLFYVARTPGAMGYVALDSPHPGVKILIVD